MQEIGSSARQEKIIEYTLIEPEGDVEIYEGDEGLRAMVGYEDTVAMRNSDLRMQGGGIMSAMVKGQEAQHNLSSLVRQLNLNTHQYNVRAQAMDITRRDLEAFLRRIQQKLKQIASELGIPLNVDETIQTLMAKIIGMDDDFSFV